MQRLILAVIALMGVLTCQAQEKKPVTVKGFTFNMIKVDGGTFTMGSSETSGVDEKERPAHRVTLDTYYIAEFEVTQKLWTVVMGAKPANYTADNKPVEKISWNQAKEFITKLNTLTGMKFRLPTEAEWEYAARGGKKSKGCKWSGSNDAKAVAWCEENSGKAAHPVGQKQPNELGIYDMCGNVAELCEDALQPYEAAAQKNPVKNADGQKVSRGGSYGFSEWASRTTYRSNAIPTFPWDGDGFRLAMTL